MIDRKERGRAGETAAVSFLERQGVCILHRNYRCRWGEIDLIGKKGGMLLVIEVKMRESRQQGYPSEAVNERKQRKICRVFDYFRMENNLDECISVRFDVIEVNRQYQCRWIENAFEYHW